MITIKQSKRYKNRLIMKIGKLNFHMSYIEGMFILAQLQLLVGKKKMRK